MSDAARVLGYSPEYDLLCLSNTFLKWTGHHKLCFATAGSLPVTQGQHYTDQKGLCKVIISPHQRILMNSDNSISFWSDLSTILACITAMVALIIGTIQFYLTQASTRESQAVDLFLKWNELNIEEAGIGSTAPPNNQNVRSIHWYGNCKMAITEALYEVSHRSPSWVKTCEWMLEMQHDFIAEGGFDVNTYCPRFKRFCRSRGYGLKSS